MPQTFAKELEEKYKSFSKEQQNLINTILISRYNEIVRFLLNPEGLIPESVVPDDNEVTEFENFCEGKSARQQDILEQLFRLLSSDEEIQNFEDLIFFYLEDMAGERKREMLEPLLKAGREEARRDPTLPPVRKRTNAQRVNELFEGEYKKIKENFKGLFDEQKLMQRFALDTAERKAGKEGGRGKGFKH